jgi:hypothetical protein
VYLRVVINAGALKNGVYMPNRKKKPSNYFLESALKEIDLLRKHFHVEGNDDDVRIAEEVTPKDVINFYTDYFTRVRPSKLSLDKIFPEPDPRKLRALYMGNSDANYLLNVIIRHVLYVDQILIVDPFLTIFFGDHPQSVLKRPEEWVTTLVNWALCLCALEEWIKQGIILIIPHLFYYHPEWLTMPSSLRDTPAQRKAFEDNFIKEMLLRDLPERREAILDFLAKKGRKFTDDERAQLLEEVEQYERENPIRFRLASDYYIKHFPQSQTHGEIFGMSNGGLPLIHAPRIAERTGSFLIFQHQFVYENLCLNVNQTGGKSNTLSLQQLSLAFQELSFPFLNNISSKKALDLRNQGYLLSFRNYLRELWQAVTTIEDQQLLDSKIADFCDKLTAEYLHLEEEWEQIRKDFVVSAAITGAVTGLNVIAPGTIALAFAAAVGTGYGLAGYQSVKELRQVNQKPLAVFLKLAH